MSQSTLLFVHGTGVRSESFSESLEQIRSKVAEFQLPCKVEACLWGDVLGIDFDGLSLPEEPVRSDAEEALALRWEYLKIDPVFDLRLWCTPSTEPVQVRLGEVNSAVSTWEDTISRYVRPEVEKVELSTLLQRNRIERFFLPAWEKVVGSDLPETAFAGAGEDGPAVSRVFAEAVAAQMMHDAAAADPPFSLPPLIAGKIVTVMLFDWQQARLGLKDLLHQIFGAATKTIVRPLRARASKAIAPAIGDILNYVAVGQDIRTLIRKKIELLSGDVFLMAHSLGGIACFELMVEARTCEKPELANVRGLITVGSQAPLLYEFGALKTLPKGTELPAAFPAWLNIYDENDLLSYRADRLFPAASADKQVDSMLPPFEAHSGYWMLDDTWQAIKALMNKAHG